MKTTCTCLTFARSGKLHKHHCPKYQATLKRQLVSAPSERKAGKHNRINKMLKVLRRGQEPMIDEELMVLLEVKKEQL